MDDLPDEIISTIFGYCDPPDIENLRLTCKTTLRVANEHLLPEVVLFMHRESLKACAGVAAHPVFSKTAKSLWIQADRPQEKTFHEWECDCMATVYSAARARACIEIEYSGRHNNLTSEQKDTAQTALERELKLKAKHEAQALSTEQVQEHFDHAVRLFSETKEIFDDGSLSTCLRAILEHCPNLDTVDLTMGGHIRTRTTRHNRGFKLGRLSPSKDLDYHNPGESVTIKLVLAAAEANFEPRVVRLGHISHLAFMHAGITQNFQTFLDKVEVLEWEFSDPLVDTISESYEDDFDDIIEDFNQRENKFVPLMRATKKLKLLRLELPGYISEFPAVQLESVVSSILWQHLTHVSISSFKTNSTVLESFLLRHKATLMRVQLGQVDLQDGNWLDCFASFAGKLPNVLQFELRAEYRETANDPFRAWYDFGGLVGPDSSSNNIYGKRISRYVIAGGDECPPRPATQEDNYTD
ncbi:unnamed protein product [Zymoseptoria tritici ST99CH_1A5]|uniref:F-box domain-containing protein n=4 Tax=Zymoseptoria tritici TaxID=1047171 RepID=F9X9M5_ZYMTI|nr:uncharacterized protein MYCGRDRAFT_109190 [Zymoseptoria tritici IPO323]SMQ50090.1 unnamed protein product [Zymoseptoria tritici ST99CH_3D7]SMR51068.1 unnamed protein product [Zymoseptoria tritici ST99CH_1E4]SMR52007.1 unnamed protein product [Zymoseptoria tritici ST99CH_3D1]SMY23760.1 unnamed protein product [Zymoseptoria tritici ST99CH_1A5]EGP88329.1 hypothetical protein MYCGRDRAFT_109190 [Zymoseptoria tritici IPO323]